MKLGTISSLDYHSNRNRLMPVIEKIASLKYPINIYISHIQKIVSIYEMNKDYAVVRESEVRLSPIEVTYNVVVEFIKGYNKQNNGK